MIFRVFLIRHGETQWSFEGKHTGSTDIPLTFHGEQQVKETRIACVGKGKLIDPSEVAVIYCSPRFRARRTAELLNIERSSGVGGENLATFLQTSAAAEPLTTTKMVGVNFKATELLREWDYGEYEGLNIAEVRKVRREKGHDQDRNWNIWRDGCEGGESPQQVSSRLDHLIADIKIQAQGSSVEHTEGGAGSLVPQNVVCVAHGHILSALAMRWAGLPLESGLRLVIETSGLAVLGFEHDDVGEPAILLGTRP